ncbi:hypothetical protein O181_060338 [Austropuccinia psidii MF-1]|uniref:hydroxyisourate hydrolase n=1 Tax=Austropuccinia psidii MF-1 TaxID=1389203 RepID=A0A9Q3EGC5_9BASI|nr:hypothetical protein [Austropuccinia psidii MF-1]
MSFNFYIKSSNNLLKTDTIFWVYSRLLVWNDAGIKDLKNQEIKPQIHLNNPSNLNPSTSNTSNIDQSITSPIILSILTPSLDQDHSKLNILNQETHQDKLNNNQDQLNLNHHLNHLNHHQIQTQNQKFNPSIISRPSSPETHSDLPIPSIKPDSSASSPNLPIQSPSTNDSIQSIKLKIRSGGRPKDPVWVYFNTDRNGSEDRATCKYCGWIIERPKAFRMRDHVAQCTQIDPYHRNEMTRLIAMKEAASAAKQEEKAQMATTGITTDLFGSTSKKRRVELPLLQKSLSTSSGKSPITCHVLDATCGKPGDQMGLRLDRLTTDGFILLANGTTNSDGRCNTLLPSDNRPEAGVYKVTFFTNEFYQKKGITSFYPFVEITFEIKNPNEHHHIPLLLSPYAFSTYRGS